MWPVWQKRGHKVAGAKKFYNWRKKKRKKKVYVLLVPSGKFRMSPWWYMKTMTYTKHLARKNHMRTMTYTHQCTLCLFHARWRSYGRRLGVSVVVCLSQCVTSNCSSAKTSHCLLILQKRSTASFRFRFQDLTRLNALSQFQCLT